jgi:serine/threonine-protein kinase RsbT
VADDATTIAIAVDIDIVAARQRGRALAEAIGFSATDATLIATAISEIARNIITYARSGQMELRIVDVDRRRGIEVIAHDNGPGIPDIDEALRDGYSSGSGMGIGLPGARRLMDEFQVVAPIGVGTTVTMRKWLGRRAF